MVWLLPYVWPAVQKRILKSSKILSRQEMKSYSDHRCLRMFLQIQRLYMESEQVRVFLYIGILMEMKLLFSALKPQHQLLVW